jgi:hypothetical protein
MQTAEVHRGHRYRFGRIVVLLRCSNGASAFLAGELGEDWPIFRNDTFSGVEHWLLHCVSQGDAEGPVALVNP